MTVSKKQMANAIRALSMDAVEKAKSGHVGLPLGFADVATVLFTEFLNYDPKAPDWADRDRFVLSAGHGSMLIYSLLHLTGYDSVSLEDIKNFRQWEAPTPGHPEFGDTEGVETTTGPLGQGIATAIGMAIAERHLNARFGDDLVGHKTYVVAGDGCLMEGVSQEAITLAGHMGLKNLIVLFDDNAVTIDGGTDMADATDQCQRFAASGWQVERIDGHDEDAIRGALQRAQSADKPTMIACKTVIGYGAPNIAGTGPAHGGPYGAEEIQGIRKNIGWPHEPFVIPDDILGAWREAGAARAGVHKEWQGRLEASSQKGAFEKAVAGVLPSDLGKTIADYKRDLVAEPKSDATRKWSGKALEVLTEAIPEMIGGSADLTGSNNTKTSHTPVLSADDFSGRYIHYGIREHGMAAAMNGMALHGGVVPYSGTFFVFSDYSRPAIRLGALMGQRVIHVMTHDSIGLGEDGPTHQPVEHLAMARATPNLLTFRPCDGVETAECWQAALENTGGPSIIALTRQGISQSRLEQNDDNRSAQGAYVIRPASGEEKLAILATGSEVEIAIEAAKALEEAGIGARVVSMPCWELFEQQAEDYIQDTLGGDLPKIAIEAGSRLGWDRWIGRKGVFIGLDNRFGASAPAKDLFKNLGLTSEVIINAAKASI